MPVGFRVRQIEHSVTDADLAKFENIITPDLADVMYGQNAMDRGILPLKIEGTRMVGRALTVSVPSADVGVLKIALDMAGPSDVVVVNAYGNLNTALAGSGMLRALSKRGAVGFIADGAVRDVEDLDDVPVSVFARRHTTIEGPSGPPSGEINFPIACGGVVVNAGDIVVADSGGIAVVPADSIDAVLIGWEALDAKHNRGAELIASGRQVGGAEARAKAIELGCEFV